MVLPTRDFTTGPATLADIGEFSYNGCEFSSLFETKVSGSAVKDNAQRTVKLMEYTITADGYVTLPDGDDDTGDVMAKLQELLTAQGGQLVYRGRGMDLIVNPQGGAGRRDVAWGPVPELTEFRPLGQGRSAKVQWQVKTRVTEPATIAPQGVFRGVGNVAIPLLQFNYETTVSYDDAGYSSLSIRGTLEIALTRVTQGTRTLTATVDDARNVLDSRIMSGIDLSRFHVTRREFSVSRDKRTLEWDFAVEEKPYMDLPPDCTVARGTFSVRPAKAGMGLCTWLCTLRATYTVRANRPRRIAWLAFNALLRRRMVESQNSVTPKLDGNQNPGKGVVIKGLIFGPAGIAAAGLELWKEIFKKQDQGQVGNAKRRTAWLMDFSFDEGLYLDSKTVSFSATWRINTTLSHILLASGIWTKVEGNDRTLWATSVKDISGSQSWLPNKLDPRLDVIVDFGS